MKRVFRLFPPRRPTIRERQIAECYTRSPTGQVIVRLHLDAPTDILMPFEGFPASFGKADRSQSTPVLNLNKDFVDYLFARLAELEDEPLLIQINLAASAIAPGTVDSPIQDIQVAIQRYFAYLEDVRRQNLQKLAWDAALLGLLGATALGVAGFLEIQSEIGGAGVASLILNQGITVFGWLTLWEALANMLWHWRPLYQQLCLCQRLRSAQLELVSQ